MAGFYADVPANRWAYHLDGTKLFTKDSSNTLYEVTSSAASINDEDVANGIDLNSRNAFILIFPELRNLQAYFISTNNESTSYFTPGSLEVSSNTTNGLDGTWSTVQNPWVRTNNSTVPQYRTAIQSAAASSIKAIRFNFNDTQSGWYDYLRALHLYGTIPLTENPDRLIFWEPVNNNETPGPYFDWGDIPLSTAQTKQFRIKNNSATLTASSISVSAGAQTYTMAVEFSTDNTSFISSIDIGNLAPGATSSVLYVRRTVPATETIRVQAIRMTATASSWS